MGVAKSMQILSSLPAISVQANNLSRFGPGDNGQATDTRLQEYMAGPPVLELKASTQLFGNDAIAFHNQRGCPGVARPGP